MAVRSGMIFGLGLLAQFGYAASPGTPLQRMQAAVEKKAQTMRRAFATESADEVILANSAMLLSFETAAGRFSPRSIKDLTSGVTWATEPWHVRVEIGDKRSFTAHSSLRLVGYRVDRVPSEPRGIRMDITTLVGEGDYTASIRLSYFIPDQGRYFEEQITLANNGARPISVHNLFLGWCDRIRTSHTYFPIPFASDRDRPSPIDLRNIYPGFAMRADGALLQKTDHGLVVARFPDDNDVEWVALVKDGARIHYGGIGAPQADWLGFQLRRAIPPGGEIRFSTTRYTCYDGNLADGLIAYRQYMASNGVRPPAGYDPPLTYNAFYEHAGHPTRQRLLEAARWAALLGCRLLYIDAGWDEPRGSAQWNPALGDIPSLMREMKRRGLQLGGNIVLHDEDTPGGKKAWPSDYYCIDRWGRPAYAHWNRTAAVCPCVRAWQTAKTNRLTQCARQGLTFFSFDFNDFPDGGCWAEEHGHSVPMTPWEHIRAVAQQQKLTKLQNPSVLIEAHDWFYAEGRYLPAYLFRAGHDERWGFEYMWDTLADFYAGRLQNLYYFSMSYDIPLYLHMNMAKDNEHLVAFWYVASTVRHLGVGNWTGLSSEQQERFQSALGLYKQYREYFVKGVFFGNGPNVHIHSLGDKGALILLFNDSPRPAKRKATVDPSKIGLGGRTPWRVRTLLGAAAELHWDNSIAHIDQQLDAFDVGIVQLYRPPRRDD